MPGLQFYKLDLHTHTPASGCYLHKHHTPEQIVQVALEKGLAAIAITDHNTAEWIDRMKEAAQDTDLVIFPGVEVSMNEGFHLVALFDPSADQKHVESLLGAIDIKPDEYSKSEALCTKSTYEVVDKIHERGGLAVLAHIDAPKGAFFEQAHQKDDGRIRVPVNCSKLFNEANYDAVECIHGTLPEGFDEAHQLKRFPTVYQASDNPDPEEPTRHSFDGLGALHSWFKLDQIDLEGLRQCFADPEVRICLMGKYEETCYPRVVSMRLGNGGFLRNQVFDFHAGLNSIIGGKGVGKSLAVEFLRFGLGQPPQDSALVSDHISKLAKRLEPGNSVDITYQLPDGTQYEIVRELVSVHRDGTPESLDSCKNVDTSEEYHGDMAPLFPILAYSQTEVIKIAEDKNAQLQLIDRLVDTRPHEQEIAKVKAKLLDNDQRFNEAIQAKDRLEAIQKDIDTLNGLVRAIDKALDNPLFAGMKEAEERKSQFDTRYEYLEDLIARVGEWREEVKSERIASLPEHLTEDAELGQAQQIAKKAHAHILDALEDSVEELGKYKGRISDLIMAWLPEFDALSEEYKEALKDIGGDQEAKERERKELERQRKDYEKEAREYRKLIKDLGAIIEERNDLLDQLERAYRAYYQLRKEKFDELTELSDDKLQLVLEHSADRSAYAERLVDLLKGGPNAPSVSDRRKIARNVAPRRLIQLVLDRNAPHLANEADITELWAERAIEKLWSTDDFTEVLAMQHDSYPADVPSIRFRKEGGQYDDLSELSVGQKCTALLIIALCDGTMPVVIDQPEDALDIISVWEDIAKKLRRGKSSRQFILTTHNSSVAVAADSDQFIVLRAGANYGKVAASGAIDREDVREAVIDHLEGGAEPYKLRARKYNIQ